MKNIHVLPTEKPSRLWLMHNKSQGLMLLKTASLLDGIPQHIYITNDEDIMIGNFYIAGVDIYQCLSSIELEDLSIDSYCKKIILTTDPDLIKDGVWGIEDGFLEWFVKNPACEYVELKGYAIILPEESCDCDKICNECEPKQETLEEVAEKYYPAYPDGVVTSEMYALREGFVKGFKVCAKWQQEQEKNKYSEDEVYIMIGKAIKENGYKQLNFFDESYYNDILVDWFEKYKKK